MKRGRGGVCVCVSVSVYILRGMGQRFQSLTIEALAHAISHSSHCFWHGLSAIHLPVASYDIPLHLHSVVNYEFTSLLIPSLPLPPSLLLLSPFLLPFLPPSFLPLAFPPFLPSSPPLPFHPPSLLLFLSPSFPPSLTTRWYSSMLGKKSSLKIIHKELQHHQVVMVTY